MRNHFLQWRSLINRGLDTALIVAMGLLVLDVLWGVCSRFVLNAPSRWTEELATILLIWVALLGAAVAFRERQHLGVDLLTSKLTGTSRRYIAVAAPLVSICFAVFVFIGGGYQLVSQTLAAGQVTPALGLKMGYVYLAVPVSGVFIALYCCEQIFEIVSSNADESSFGESD